MLHSLREHDIEFDNEVATGAISLHRQLRGRISHDLPCECAWHTLAHHSEFSLWSDYISGRHKDFPIIECIHCDWLHLQGFNQAQRVRIHKVVSFALEVRQRLLRELDYEIGRVSTERLMASPLMNKYRITGETRMDRYVKSVRVHNGTLSRAEHLLAC